MSTAFSYAQAAKGKLSTPSAPQSVTSQAASTTSQQNSDAAANTGLSTVSQSSAPSAVSNEQDTKDNIQQPVAQAEEANMSGSAGADQVAQDGEITQATVAADDSAPPTPETRQANEAVAERRAKGPSARSSDAPDSRKARKGKKARAADKESEQEQATEKEKEPEAPKVQLFEAPIPTVNPWLQRAQTKTAQPTSARTAAATSGHQAKASVNENNQSGRPSVNGVKSQKKDAREVSDQSSRKHAPRGSRVVEKQATEALPSVADAALWPTPETAATETKPSENEEAQEEKTEPGPKDKPKWVAIPFVPSAVFETPLPSRNPRGSKTGATRGGREAGVRGAASSHGVDRAQGAGIARPSGERGPENVNGARTSSVSAPASKRTTDAFVSRDVRKEIGFNKEAANAPSAAQVNGTEETAKPAEAGAKDDGSSQQQESSETSSNEKPAGPRPDPSRESFTPAVKENGVHHHPSKSEKRSGRGRGGHPGANGHRAHGTYPAGGQAYQGPGNMGPRQNSYPGNMSMGYGMPGGGASANAHATRNSTSGGFYRANGRNGRAPPMQTAPTWNMDSSMQQMPAMPPQPYYYEQNIATMLGRQLSYYFSLNNLLKDSFLRKCMDSQGYVFVDVILSFSRIQQLTSDVNLFRMACMECPEIELVTGMEDHRDRIRRVKGWNDFVYPPGSRNEEVNFDDGPINVWKHDRNMFANQYPVVLPYQVESPGFYPPNGYPAFGNDGYQQYNTNGVNGHFAPKDTQLSAEVPEFSPNGGSTASDVENALKGGSKTNGEEHLSNGTAPVTANGDNVIEPYTNGVSASVEVASH